MLLNVIKEFDSLMTSISEYLPRFCEYKLSRCDFCHDIKLETNMEVGRYISLGYHCILPPRFKFEKIIDKETGRLIDPDNSLRLNRGDTTIVLYNKQHEMRDKGIYTEAEMSQAEGILRVEIRVEYKKVYYLKKSRELEKLQCFLQKASETAMYLMGYYFPKIFLRGDYYTYKVAKDMIISSNFKRKAKERMIMLLDLTKNCHGVNSAIEQLLGAGYTMGQVTKILSKFNELKLNPCTIPRRYNIDKLENILTLIVDQKQLPGDSLHP